MELLTKVEEILNIPMDLFHRRKGFHPVDLSRMALRCMEQGCRKGLNTNYAPNHFSVLLNPSDYKELYPFLQTIRSDIYHGLKKIVAERKYLLAGDLVVEILEDRQRPEGLPEVKGYMQDSDEPDSVVGFEQKQEQEKDNVFGSIPISGDPITILEEGITLLRDGKVEEAVEVFSNAEADLKEMPQYHASMGVAMDMLGHSDDAKQHYDQLNEADPSALIEYHRDQKQKTTGYRLETDIPGVSLLFGTNGLVMENSYHDPSATVNGKNVPVIQIQSGDVITVGTMRMHVNKAE